MTIVTISNNFPLHRQLEKRQYSSDKWLKCLWLAIIETFLEYAEGTKVCGIWRLRSKDTHAVYRWLWAFILLKLLLLGCFLSLQLWLKFYSYPILNTISEELPITDVPFPGVTICSPKPINRERVKRYVKKLYIPPEYDAAFVGDAFEFINAFTFQNWEPPTHVNLSLADEVLRLNNVTLYQAASNISASCDDFVKSCFWGSVEFPCRQKHEHLSFIPTSSYLGPCCSFNYNPWNISYRPLPSAYFGVEGGLSFIGSEANVSTGLIVFIHHPKDFTTDTAASVIVTSKLESFVEVSATVRSSSADVLELAQSKRDCLTSADLGQHNYRQAACVMSCESGIIFEICGCRPYHLPTDKNLLHKECELKDAICYKKHYDKFNSLNCEQCLPSCHDVTYSVLSYNTDLMQHNFSLSPLYSHHNHDANTFVVRVFLPKQVVPVIRKVTVMSWISLLSDLGGVFNLCLGLSVVSLVEFLYFCTYRLYYNFNQQRRADGAKNCVRNRRKY